MNTEQERADFEAWHKREMWDGGYESGYGEFYPDAYRFNERRVYENLHTQMAWRGYQAGRATLQSQDREDALVQAIQEAIALLGPEAPSCSGCEYEWNHALRVLHEAVDHARRIEGES